MLIARINKYGYQRLFLYILHHYNMLRGRTNFSFYFQDLINLIVVKVSDLMFVIYNMNTTQCYDK